MTPVMRDVLIEGTINFRIKQEFCVVIQGSTTLDLDFEAEATGQILIPAEGLFCTLAVTEAVWDHAR